MTFSVKYTCSVYAQLEQAVKQELNRAPVSFMTLCRSHYCHEKMTYNRLNLTSLQTCICHLIFKWHHWKKTGTDVIRNRKLPSSPPCHSERGINRWLVSERPLCPDSNS